MRLTWPSRDEFVRQWQGEKILISDRRIALSLYDAWSEFNATEYLAGTSTMCPIPSMPFGRIMERLATGQETGPVILILDNDDLPPAAVQADLIAWESPAMQAAPTSGLWRLHPRRCATSAQAEPLCSRDGTPLTTSVRAVQANFFRPAQR